MSVITCRSSILKDYSIKNREKIKQVINNRVRFELLAGTSLREILEDCLINDNIIPYKEYVEKIRDVNISEKDFVSAIEESRECIELLTPQFIDVIQALISLDWRPQKPETRTAFLTFLIDLASARSTYVKMVVSRLVSFMVPTETDKSLWLKGIPDESIQVPMKQLIETLLVIIEIIPLSQNIVIAAIDRHFPYFKKASFIFAGYVHNVFDFITLKPILKEHLFPIILQKYVCKHLE